MTSNATGGPGGPEPSSGDAVKHSGPKQRRLHTSQPQSSIFTGRVGTRSEAISKSGSGGPPRSNRGCPSVPRSRQAPGTVMCSRCLATRAPPRILRASGQLLTGAGASRCVKILTSRIHASGRARGRGCYGKSLGLVCGYSRRSARRRRPPAGTCPGRRRASRSRCRGARTQVM